MRLVLGVFSLENALKALLGTLLLIVELLSTARRLRGDLFGDRFIVLFNLLLRCIIVALRGSADRVSIKQHKYGWN